MELFSRRHGDTGPPPKPSDGYKRGDPLTYASDKAAREGRFEEALSLARDLLKSKKWQSIFNEEVFRFCVIAECQIIHGDLDGARRSLSEALDVASRSPNFWHGWFFSNTSNQPLSLRNQGFCAVAKLLADLGDFERAEKLFEIIEARKHHYIPLNKEDCLAYYLAVSYARNNDPSNADRMLLHIPDDRDRHDARVHIWAASAWYSLGPEHPRVAGHLNNLAELYRAQGKYAEAERMEARAKAIRAKSE